MKEKKVLLLLAQSFIGTGIFFLYVQHVRSIFEIRTNIAHLTQTERESLLRRDDALYYHFYKMLTDEPDFWSGYEKLKNVTDIEYPQSVNVLQRFHVLPELIIGYMYHQFRYYANHKYFPFLSCWRSHDIRVPIEHHRCDGFGQPMQFYFEFVWLLGGATILIIYMYGTFLSENIIGGIYSVVSYIMFHSFASKIYERPVARENFAFPIIFMQIFYLCLCIDRVNEKKAHTSRLYMTIGLTTLTTISLLCWQFASIIFATQIIIMMTPWSLKSVSHLVSSSFTFDYALSQLMANVFAYYLSHGNKQFMFAWQMGPAIGLFLVSAARSVKHELHNNEFSLKTMAMGVLMAISAQGTIIDLVEKSGLARTVDNTFVFYRDLLLQWCLEANIGFSVSLAACNPAYQRIEWSQLWGLVKTLIVKPYCMYGVVMLAKFFRKWRKCSEKKQPSTDLIERSKKYVLEDFLEDNHISMRDMSNKETENDLNECLKLLENCEYDYDRYKKEKAKLKKGNSNEHMEFINDIKKLKEQIHELNDKKNKEREAATMSYEKVTNKKKSHIRNDDDNDDDEKDDADAIKSSTEEQHPQSPPQRTTEKLKPSKKENKPNNDTSNGNGRRTAYSKRGNATNTSPCSASTTSYAAAATVDDNDMDTYSYKNLFTFHYLYSFIQMAVFTVIGLCIKKLFFLSFTQGCVIAPTVCSKFWYRKHRNIFWAVSLTVFVSSVVNPGIVNIHEEYFPTKHSYGNDDLDSMLEWIKMNTESDAVFAGPIDIIGTVHLTTNRPIVNHAHLEMRQMGDRTEHVYSVFSRQQSSDVYNQCSQLKIQYLIITLSDCTDEISDDCDMLAIWDDMQPAYRKYPQFCSELTNKNIPSFLKVFGNDHYGIIKMFSQSVQINLKYIKMPEKNM